MRDDELDRLSVEELRKRLASVEKGVRKSEKATKYARFEPVDFQRIWFETFASRAFQVLVWVCGNRTGKSESAAVIVISECLGVLPEALGGRIPRKWSDLAGTREGLTFLAMCPTIRQSGKFNLAKKLRTYITPDMLSGPPKKDEDGNDIEWNFVTGASLHLQSYAGKTGSVEGPDWDGVWFDEPPPRNTYVGVVRGIADRGGFVLVTATPVGDNASWFNADLIEPSENLECIECNNGLGSISHAEAVEQSPPHGFVKVFKAELHDNCSGGPGLDGTMCMGNGGYIPHKQIEILRATWTPQERLIREFGDITAITNVEFPYVNEKDHLVKDINPVEFGLPIIEIVDPAAKRGLHVKWYTVTQQNLWYCFQAARISSERGFHGMAEEIKKYRRQIGRAEPDIALLDPRGAGSPVVTTQGRSNWFEQFKKEGLFYKPAIGMTRAEGDTGAQTSIEALHDWLRPQFNPGTEQMEVPKLRFCHRLKFIDEGPLWAYRRFAWDHLASNRKKYLQKGKDWIDLDVYLVLYASQHKLTYDRLGRREQQPSRAAKLAESYAGSGPRPYRKLQVSTAKIPWRGQMWRTVG